MHSFNSQPAHINSNGYCVLISNRGFNDFWCTKPKGHQVFFVLKNYNCDCQGCFLSIGQLTYKVRED